jgi:hypothetical protein
VLHTTRLLLYCCLIAAVGGYCGLGLLLSQVLHALRTLHCAALLAVALPRQHSWQVTHSACIVLVGVSMKHQWHSVPGCDACCVCRVVCAVVEQLYYAW